MSDHRRMSTAQIRIITDSQFKSRQLELLGFLALVTVYAVARLLNKWWSIEITEIVGLAGWFGAKFTAKSPEKVTEYALQSLPPQRVNQILERVMSHRPPPTPIAPREETPAKPQPHHVRKDTPPTGYRRG